MYKHRILAGLMIVLFATITLVGLPRQTQGAQFILSSWDFPDEYGQGIVIVTPSQNSSGSFVTIINPSTGTGDVYPNNPTLYYHNFTDNTALRFKVRVRLNYTQLDLGLSHPADIDLGRNNLRVNLEMFIASESVFSLQNMTFDNTDGLTETGIWYYEYLDIVNVILIAGQIYTVVITLQIFFS